MGYSMDYIDSCRVVDKPYWQALKKYRENLKFIEGCLEECFLYDIGSLQGHEWDSSNYLDIPIALAAIEELRIYLESYPSDSS